MASVALSTEAFADCTGPLNAGYDDCVAFEIGDVPQFDGSNWCDYRDALGISNSYDSNSGMHTVVVDPAAGDGVPAVRRPTHEGLWSTFEDYEDAFYGIFFGEGCQGVKFDRPNTCDPLGINIVIRTPPIWVTSSGISLNQDLDPLWGALASSDGLIEIPNIVDIDLLWNALQSCDTQSSTNGVDTFEAQQCSFVNIANTTWADDPVCGSGFPHVIPKATAHSRFEYFKFNNLQTNFSYDLYDGVFVGAIVEATVAKIENEYYDQNSNFHHGFERERNNTHPFHLSAEAEGVCGWGRAQKVGVVNPVYLKSKAGTAPQCF